MSQTRVQQRLLLSYQPVLVAEWVDGVRYGIVWGAVEVEAEAGGHVWGTFEVAGRKCRVLQASTDDPSIVGEFSWVHVYWLDEETGS